MFKFIPIWGFDFKVIIDNHVVAISPGEHIVVPIRLELIRGKPQDVDLDVTKWESVGLTASIHFSSFVPGHPWKASLMIRSSSNTPPGSYLFTVRGSTKGTFHTSADAVTVVVEPKGKEKSDEDQEDFQQKQPSAVAPANIVAEPSPSFSLDKLFQPSPKPATSGKPSAGGKAPYVGGLTPGITATLGIVGAVIIFSIIMMANGGFGPTRNCVGGQISGWPECTDCSGNYERTIYNGKDYGMCRATKVRTDDPNLCLFSCK